VVDIIQIWWTWEVEDAFKRIASGQRMAGLKENH
jgi:hypothetical protein